MKPTHKIASLVKTWKIDMKEQYSQDPPPALSITQSTVRGDVDVPKEEWQNTVTTLVSPHSKVFFTEDGLMFRKELVLSEEEITEARGKGQLDWCLDLLFELRSQETTEEGSDD